MKKIQIFFYQYRVELFVFLYLLALLKVLNFLYDYDDKRPNWEKGKDYLGGPYEEVVHLGNMRGDTNLFFRDPAKRIDLGNNKPGISDIWIAERSIPVTYDLNLPLNENNISITYEGIGKYKNFSKLKTGLTKGTYGIEQGNTLYITLPEGRRVIYAVATDIKDSIVYEYPPLHININSRFLETEWHWPFVFFLLFTPMLFVFYRLFRNKLKSELDKKKAVEGERYKISADLHDEIGATVSSLQINSAIVKKQLIQNPEKAVQTLDKIIAQSRELSENIGDIVWSLKAGEHEFMTLRIRIINFINQALGSSDINYGLSIDSRINDIKSNVTLRKNILLLVKEAINNILKHSKATKVELSIQVINNSIELKIVDNGIGFEIDKKKRNGLFNLKFRTEESGGLFNLTSIQNQGTTIFCQIPFIP